MAHRIGRQLAIVVATFLIGACATHPKFPAGINCETPTVSISDNFPGARRGDCSVLSPTHVRLDILPENTPPINDSPWFAFQLDAKQPTRLRITLRYTDGHHRYLPKVSYDSVTWQAIDEQAVEESRNGRTAIFELNVDERPMLVSAQELVLPRQYDSWCKFMQTISAATCSILGYSRNQQAVFRADANDQERDVLLIVGRQHPPEVSGAFAFLRFADTLFAHTTLATRFREHFRVIAIPMLNPDGVLAGHWRNNLGGVDLNRDWGPFTQPETQLIRDLLAELDDNDSRIRFFLDFHSTQRNVFYTQNDAFPTTPPGLMAQWLERSKARIEDYDFENDARPVSDQANSKNYMYKRYGIPTATYEVGDETDRAATENAASVFAEELMSLLLDQEFAR